jgi:hypothetical protein
MMTIYAGGTELPPQWHWHTDLYLIGCGDMFVKIGISANVKERLRKLQRSNPMELEVWRIYRTEACDIRIIEKALHYDLAKHCVRGEWFHREAADKIIALEGDYCSPSKPKRKGVHR